MLWVVNTNTNACHIYSYQKKPAQLTLIKEIIHPENRLKKGEYFTSDKPGRYQSDGMKGRGSYSQSTDPKTVAIDDFSREIAKTLDQGRNQHTYENLIIIAPPQMMGYLSRHLDKHVKDLIRNHLEKDLQHLSPHELLDYLHKNAQFPSNSR